VEQDLVWLDEECPESIYGECLIRTMTTGGLILLTFTPMQGLTDVVLRFLPGGAMPTEDTGRYVVTATWDDAPHLSEEAKREILESTPPYLRDARSKGIAHMGSGVIYPVDLDSITVDPFEISPYWAKVYAMDVGWNRTAAVWGALDRDSGVLYLYSEHYVGQEQPAIHAQAIQARGNWIKGVIDPSSRGRSQADGKALYDEYLSLGLHLYPANNVVEAGIYEVWSLLSSGRMKVFSTCRNWFDEIRLYRRDEKGKIVKDKDHLMDATRYLVVSGLDVAKSLVQAEPKRSVHDPYSRGLRYTSGGNGAGWMAG
jgi:phage terminase large subunit-like protein